MVAMLGVTDRQIDTHAHTHARTHTHTHIHTHRRTNKSKDNTANHFVMKGENNNVQKRNATPYRYNFSVICLPTSILLAALTLKKKIFRALKLHFFYS